jgi:hypothetical protein
MGSYGKSRRKPLKRKALTARRAARAGLSLQPVAQPPGGFAAGIDWRPLTLLDGGVIKAGSAPLGETAPPRQRQAWV